MTAYEDTANKIRTRFKTEVEDVFLGLSGQVQYDNRKFTPPDGGALHCRATINWGEASANGAGSAVNGRRIRVVGVLQVQVFRNIDRGDKDQLELIDHISDKFSLITAAGVLYRAATVFKVGRSEDGKLWQLNVNVPFQCDTTT